MTYSIKPGTPVKRKVPGILVKAKKFWQYTKKYLKDKHFRGRQQVNIFATNYEIRKKIKQASSLIVDVLFTGSIIAYCINYQNLISYGLIAALATYYFKEIVEIIKTPLS